MSAKVEVIIDELYDVLSVPIQTVTTQEGVKLCYVVTGSGPEKREVETGAFNNDFVEIKSGLVEGDKVLLNPPRVSELEAGGKKGGEKS
jgi:multidrug efflux pump subunit AcrA (membrane-fusion protein)